MTDGFPFPSGARMDVAGIDKAVTFTHAAAHGMTLARAFDSYSQLRRDEALSDARAALVEALWALDNAMQPEPPRVSPFPIRRTDPFVMACDIASAGTGKAIA